MTLLIIINRRIRGYFLLLTVFLFVGTPLLGQKTVVNQLREALSEVSSDNVKANTYLNLAAAYRFFSIDSALYYNETALDLAKKNNLEHIHNTALTNKGLFLNDKADYANALNLLQQSLKISKERNDSNLIAITTHIIGSVYLRLEEFEKAIEHYQLALEQFYQQGEKDRIIASLNSLGSVSLNLNKYDKALEYYEKVRIGSIENKNSLYTAIATSNIAEVFLAQGKLDTSLVLSKKVIELIELEVYPLLIVSSMINIAKGHYLKKEYEQALVAGKKAITICEKYQLHKHKTDIYEILAQVFLKLKKNLASINYANKGMSFVKNANVRGGELTFYKLLSKAYEQENQLKEALAMERQYNQLNDSLHQLQIEKKIANLALATEVKQKKSENALLKAEKKNQALIIQQRTYAISVISLGMLLLGIILAQIYLARNKLRYLNEQLAAQAKELKQNYQFKNRLFGNIAHELRTPLTLVSGQLDLISKDSHTQAGLYQKVQIAKHSSLSLLDLTNQILDLTKSEVGLVKLSIVSFSLQDLLNNLFCQFEPIAKRKDITLQFTNVQEANIALETDAKKLLTILQNLLANAIKYNKAQGSIKLYYEDLGSSLKIAVEDSGQGISPKELPLIFDRYYQSEQTETSEGGIGIGLAICKEYIQLLKGTIEARSKVGQGSIFTIQLPKHMANPNASISAYKFPKPLTPSPSALPTLQPGVTINEEYLLVVEDSLELSHYLYDLLNEEYEVYFASNGKEALRQIDIQAPIAIISDWMMPIMDGKALVKQLKQSEKLAAIPVLMLTARTDIQEQLALLRIGVDDYLTKPFDAEVLRAHLNRLIDQARQKLHISREEELMNQLETNLLVFNQKDQDLLKQVEQTIIENISNFDLTIEKISSIIGLSGRHLGRKIKQLTKLTASQFVNEIRFREAKRMLIEKEYSSVKAVVYSVGFKSEKVFSRNFKKRFGKYPKDFLR